jgi:hypothetical protein
VTEYNKEKYIYKSVGAKQGSDKSKRYNKRKPASRYGQQNVLLVLRLVLNNRETQQGRTKGKKKKGRLTRNYSLSAAASFSSSLDGSLADSVDGSCNTTPKWMLRFAVT